MNLIELDKLQKEYESRLLEVKGLNRKDLFDKKLLALKTELGELANEQRTWKFWSKDQEPRTTKRVICDQCEGTGNVYWDSNYVDEEKKYLKCECCRGFGKASKNPLLEEFIDCLKFSLSIASDLDIEPQDIYPWHGEIDEDLPKTFNLAFYYIGALSVTPGKVSQKNYFQNFFLHLMSLGFKHFNFTEEQITAAFKEKHQVNYKRLETGY
ncbi:dUTP diphosphatase [Rossellomorea vietnamensis]|uniref:dUTP diphosphatase n=1 Tax=Rossellomorea vietnamensis TaxID=218284 RepID=UPI000551849C|nr:dUTP diphosphatase [Rossellomorea vietnamensis]